MEDALTQNYKGGTELPKTLKILPLHVQGGSDHAKISWQFFIQCTVIK